MVKFWIYFDGKLMDSMCGFERGEESKASPRFLT